MNIKDEFLNTIEKMTDSVTELPDRFIGIKDQFFEDLDNAKYVLGTKMIEDITNSTKSIGTDFKKRNDTLSQHFTNLTNIVEIAE